jgi:hypothetical protein
MPPIAPTRATALASPLRVFAGWQVAASCPACRVLRIVKLKLDTTNLELIDWKRESGKFRGAWHHAAGVRGVAAMALVR